MDLDLDNAWMPQAACSWILSEYGSMPTWRNRCGPSVTAHSVAVSPSWASRAPCATSHFALCPATAFEYTICCRCFCTVVVCRLACDCCSPAIRPMSCRPIGHGSVSISAIADLPRARWWCCAGDLGLGRAAARRAGVGWDIHSPAPCSGPSLACFGPAGSGQDLKTIRRGGGLRAPS